MNKIVKMAVLGSVALIILIALITGSNILFFWSIFNGLQNLIIVAGIHPVLTKAIASVLLAIIVMLPLGKLLLSFTPIPQKNKSLYRALVFLFIGIFFLFTYFGTRNAFFDPSRGIPLKYYSEAPDGKIRFFAAPGFDPETGDTLLPVTKEIIFKFKGFQLKKNEPALVPVPSVPQPKVEYAQTLSDAEILLYLAQKRAQYDRQSDSLQKAEVEIGKEEARPEINSEVKAEIELGTIPHKPKTLAELGVTVAPAANQTSQPSVLKEENNLINPGPLASRERIEAYALALKESGGYAISIIHNPQTSELGEVFKTESFYSCYSRTFNACETTIDNISRGTFEFYDERKILLFKIPPRKKLVILLELKTHYFKLPESSKFIQFNVPKREELNVKILGDKMIEPGEVITGAISDSNI